MCEHNSTGLQKSEPAVKVEQQLERLIDAFEDVDWRRVDGMTPAEAAALGERLRGVDGGR